MARIDPHPFVYSIDDYCKYLRDLPDGAPWKPIGRSRASVLRAIHAGVFGNAVKRVGSQLVFDQRMQDSVERALPKGDPRRSTVDELDKALADEAAEEARLHPHEQTAVELAHENAQSEVLRDVNGNILRDKSDRPRTKPKVQKAYTDGYLRRQKAARDAQKRQEANDARVGTPAIRDQVFTTLNGRTGVLESTASRDVSVDGLIAADPNRHLSLGARPAYTVDGVPNVALEGELA
jgi:hypothetical protein